MQWANDWGRLDCKYSNPADILLRLNLSVNDKPTNAAIAMFGKEPPTEIQMAIFATEFKRTFIDIKRYGEKRLLELVDICEMHIRRNMRWRVVFDGSPECIEVPEVPVLAIREVLLNPFAHRGCHMARTNEVAICSNRIEICNPGAFPEGFTPEDFIEGSGKSVQRNPTLAHIFYYSKEMENRFA
jgi:ATP-dependent DNA helicase RecG